MPHHTRPLDRPWPGERLAGETVARPAAARPADRAAGGRETARASAERLFAGKGAAPPRPAAGPGEVRLRSSLAGVPSDLNDGELKARRDAYERTLWQAHRGLVLRLDDPDLTGTHRLMIEALAKARGFV